MPRPLSRPARWLAACAAARAALEELEELRQEYEEWRDNIPENLEGGTLAEKLDEVCALDFEAAADVLDEAEGADLPLGFGRD